MRYDYDYVKAKFEDREYSLLSSQDEYTGVLCKLRYICNKHKDMGEQIITFSKLNSCGQGCVYCGRIKTGMSKRINLDIDYVEKICNELELDMVSVGRDNGIRVVDVVCPKHSNFGVQRILYGNLIKKKKHGCKYCSTGKLPEWYVLQKIAETDPYVRLNESYINYTTPISCTCTKHNYTSLRTPQNIISGQGCKFCGIEKLSSAMTNSIEKARGMIRSVRDDVDIVEYNGYGSICKFVCNEHHLEFEDYFCRIVNMYGGCEKCKKRTKEDAVFEELCKFGYTIERQKRFDDCRDKSTLPFDFYIRELNTLVEYDGKQHFEPRNFGGISDERANENFIITKTHDLIKNSYCDSHGIHLIRIPYTEDKNIYSYLLREIKIIKEMENVDSASSLLSS